MEIIKDKVLKRGVVYNNVKFVRCYNAGGILKNCIWESGISDYGTFVESVWKNGIWLDGIWESGTFEHGIWVDGVWEDKWERGLWISGKNYTL